METVETGLRPDEAELNPGLLQTDPEDQADPADEFGLPFEAGDEYSCAPLEFEEMAESLRTVTFFG